MTRVVIIEPEDADVCDLCGAVEETRPYGPKGEKVCFSCDMKDEEAAKKQFDKVLTGEELTTLH